MNPRIVPVILSGGSGTRLWPMSTDARPKQFLPLVGEETMFQLTAMRTGDTDRFLPPIVVGNARHADLIDSQLADIGIEASALILEPAARNTAPAIALAALAAPSPEALMLVMPSDHVVREPDAFRAAIDAALPAAEAGWLVTFGITPTSPETGYGYIEMAGEHVDGSNARAVHRFVEKPAREQAEAMLAKGGFVWNAGIFLMRADAYLAAMRDHAPEMLERVAASMNAATRRATTILPDPALFAAAPADSIDYAVMEKASRVAVMPVACGWSDVGSWDSLAETTVPDEHGSHIAGNVVAIDSRNCIVRSDGMRISLHGVSDLVIVASGNEVMILPRGATQKVKDIVAKVRERDEAAEQGAG